MVKIGIVGLGKMGVSHLSILNYNPNVEIVGVSDTSRFILRTFSKLTKFPVYDNYEKMFRERKPDAVVISTPSSLHYEIAKFFLKNNVHVFIEKPLSLSYSQSKDLVKMSHNKVVNQVGYHNRFIATFQYAKNVLENGYLGEIYNFIAQAHGPAITKPSKSWRTKSIIGGGCLYDYGSHVINLLSFILGEPENVNFANFGSIHSKNVDDIVDASLSYKDGKFGYLKLNWSDESYRRMTTELTIWGTNGKIYVNSQEVHIFIKDNKVTNDKQLKKGWNIKYITDFPNDVKYFVRGEEYSAQLEYFVEKIKNKDFKNLNSFKNAASTDLVIEKINSFRRF